MLLEKAGALSDKFLPEGDLQNQMSSLDNSESVTQDVFEILESQFQKLVDHSEGEVKELRLENSQL